MVKPLATGVSRRFSIKRGVGVPGRSRHDVVKGGEGVVLLGIGDHGGAPRESMGDVSVRLRRRARPAHPAPGDSRGDGVGSSLNENAAYA